MASEKADAWMPLYVTDYLGDTMHLTTEQHGAYMLLLMACWKGDGHIPNDDGWLAAITKLPVKRWKLHRLTLLKFFTIADDFIAHKRVLKEREKAKEISAKRSESGKIGAANKKQIASNREANAYANGQQTPKQNATPSPSPLRASEPNGSGAVAPRDADPIWHTGLAFLTRKGIPNEPARKFLGKLKREAGDIDAAALLAQAEAEDITDPIPWLTRAAVNARERKKSGAGNESKTLTGMRTLQGMKDGLVHERDHRRADQVDVLGVGQNACLRLGSDHGRDVD